jgi:Ca2+-binding EF-hand superfamily protein
MLENLDTNKDGKIDANEAQASGRMIENLLAGAGLEAKYPIVISKIVDAMNNRMVGNTPSSTTQKTTEQTKQAESSSLVRPFGETTPSLPTVLGFGVASNSTSSAVTSASSSDSSSSSSSSLSADESIRNYAKSLLKDNDKNGNGKLEKDEWSKMNDKYAAADEDHDGIITQDELIKFLVADQGVTAGTSTSTAGVGGARPKRLATPIEKLASYNLPSQALNMFRTADVDGDGQISMAEFIRVNGDTAESASSFAQIDIDNDGVITVQDILKATRRR